MKRLLWLAILAGAVCAQSPNIVGIWQGTLETGPTKLRVAFHIAANDKKDGFTSTLDSLDQNALGIPVQETVFSGNKLHLDMPGLRAQFDGTLNADATEIVGTFNQGVPIPLTLKRVDRIEMPRRPQEPKPPYPYDIEEVSYESQGAHIAGTLTLPRGPGPFPAAILITGSGPQDRDESIMGHKPFWIIADDLARRGIAVLRTDDRGVGKSTGNSAAATFYDMAADVLAGVEFLKTRQQIDGKHIGVIGHSEGGIVGPVAAVRSDAISFVVMLAGTGVSGEQVVYRQGELIARAAGAPDAVIAQTRALQETIFGIIKEEKDPAAAGDKLRAALRQFGLPDAAIATQIGQWNSPEIRSILTFDPAEALRRVKVPVLALNGSRDLQVSPQQNLPAISAALEAGGNTDSTVRELPGLNHLFQRCNKCTVGEYGELEETFSPAALQVLGDWIVRHMQGQIDKQ